MLASSVLQPRKSEVKHGVRHREQPRKQGARRQRANRNTTPSASATASITRESRTPPYARQNPQRVPEPASARQSPRRVPEPQRMPEPPACARARQRAPGPQRMPEPPAHAGTPDACQDPSARRDENRAPERQPSRPSDFGVLIEPSTGLRDVNRAERRVPRALAGPSSEFPRRRIVIFVQPWSILTILRSLKAKTRDYLRHREAHTRTTGKIVRFSLPIPRKTVCFDHQRPKQTVFRIAHPTRQPIPMSNKQHSRHRSR